MSSRMRATRSKTGMRRSHHALSLPRLSLCEKCGEEKLAHKMCGKCGSYRGRTVIDVLLKTEKRIKRRKENLKTMGQEPEDAEEKASREQGAVKPLDVKKLSDNVS